MINRKPYFRLWTALEVAGCTHIEGGDFPTKLDVEDFDVYVEYAGYVRYPDGTLHFVCTIPVTEEEANLPG